MTTPRLATGFLLGAGILLTAAGLVGVSLGIFFAPWLYDQLPPVLIDTAAVGRRGHGARRAAARPGRGPPGGCPGPDPWRRHAVHTSRGAVPGDGRAERRLGGGGPGQRRAPGLASRPSCCRPRWPWDWWRPPTAGALDGSSASAGARPPLTEGRRRPCYTPPPSLLRARGVAAQHASLSRWRSPVRIRSGPPRALARLPRTIVFNRANFFSGVNDGHPSKTRGLNSLPDLGIRALEAGAQRERDDRFALEGCCGSRLRGLAPARPCPSKGRYPARRRQLLAASLTARSVARWLARSSSLAPRVPRVAPRARSPGRRSPHRR